MITQTALGQQIVAAASFDDPPNELANRRTLGQNDPCIDIWSIGFAPGNVRLIDEQFQFIANFLATPWAMDCCIAIAAR